MLHARHVIRGASCARFIPSPLSGPLLKAGALRSPSIWKLLLAGSNISFPHHLPG